ncbi:amino acid ABC transporter ATP-binding protein [Phytohabitans aurantiacus]|uniref:Arginine ABC transporter ATP-binding protein n=1 Tax=Phytohabitans aurantiacus TaxID=3016789 RepID=A0ABQ5RAV2_9ACTN|nr:amino acid ABC transporter ATP-binding protein [Phytohabitans aurantiacus]GLI03864.1 arginine ABC transporter ATP-binding protein [Phytohabitans aurantiacus]
MIEATGLFKHYGPHEVLRDVCVTVAPGEVVAVIGPSGSGKSTLLRCLNGLAEITRGEITVAGTLLVRKGDPGQPDIQLHGPDLRALRAELGMVFQRYNLFPHMTAVGNVIEAPVHVRGVTVDEATEQAHQLLRRVGLTHRAQHYPQHLSGGEQQRVAIARALAMRPKAMLFDEATSALDPETVGEVLAVMRDLAADGMTMVVVTHEIGFARDAADRVVVMDEGSVVEEGPAKQVLSEPTNPRTQSFLRRVIQR